MNFISHLAGFGNAAYAHIDVRDAVPCGIIHYTIWRKIKDALKGSYGISGSRSENAIGSNCGDCRIVLGNAV